MGNSLKPHIENASKTGTCNLSGQKLTEFPELLFSLSNRLRMLDLSQNGIQNLPSNLGDFTNLKSLSLNKNRLVCFPDAIGNLSKLENLNSSFNRLYKLPTSFANLGSLKQLNLSMNSFTMFPIEICSLNFLEFVDLSNNKIQKLPDQIANLKALELNVNKNRLSCLNDGLSNCSRLRVLRVEENCLSINVFSVDILKNSQISLIEFEGNTFSHKEFQNCSGYEEYMERYTATKKKIG